MLLSLLLLSLGLAFAAPIHAGSTGGGSPSFSLDDARFQPLSEGAGDYFVSFPDADNSGFVNAAGGTLAVNLEIDFNEVGEGTTLEFDGNQAFATAMLVLTTVRLGVPSGPVGCPIPGSLPLAPANFDPGSVGGDASGPAFFVSDPPAGFVCDDEGDILLGVPINADTTSASTIAFDLSLLGEITDSVYIQYKAFLVVPEPATAALVLTGLGILAVVGRRRI